MIRFRQVTGHSMSPDFKEGQVVVGFLNLATANGDTVIASYQDHEIIKKITSEKDDLVFLSGKDALHSPGWVSKDKILARVVWPRIKS